MKSNSFANIVHYCQMRQCTRHGINISIASSQFLWIGINGQPSNTSLRYPLHILCGIQRKTCNMCSSHVVQHSHAVIWDTRPPNRWHSLRAWAWQCRVPRPCQGQVAFWRKGQQVALIRGHSRSDLKRGYSEFLDTSSLPRGTKFPRRLPGQMQL